MEKEQVATQQETNEQGAKRTVKSKAKQSRGVGTLLARILLVLLFGTSFFLSVFPWGRAIVRTSLLLPALISASEPPPLSLFGDAVSFKRTTISSRNGPIFLDIYEPTTSPPLVPGVHAAIINIVGVGDNRNAAQLINLSRSFAREGIVVVNMGTPTLFNFQVTTQDSEAVVQTFQTIAHWPGVDPNRIGILGFSAGGTLACLAAIDPRIRDRLAFITLFGSYFNATSLLRDFGRRALIVNGHSQPWQPYYVPEQVLSNAMSSTLTSTESKLFQQTFVQNGRPLDASQQSQLSPSAAAAYHLLEGDEPARVDANLALLSPQMRAKLEQLSPSSVISGVHAPIYLLHDRSDQYVPFTQSRDFAAALAHIHHVYDFAEFGIFSHVEVRAGLNYGQLLGDGSQLFRIVSKMLIPAS